MKKGAVITAMVIVILGGLFYFSRILAAPKNYLSYEFSETLKPVANFFQGVFGGRAQTDELSSLILENEQLKAELLALQKSPSLIMSEGKEYLSAKVYSTYPFNNRNLLSINVGAASGVREGAAVVIGKYILLGQIAEVHETSSIVRTVFDPGWELPVKVGLDSIDVLFVGGREPKATLITKDKKITKGDPIYSASRDFPYGLKIGELTNIKSDIASAFQEADISLPYKIKNITDVMVILR